MLLKSELITVYDKVIHKKQQNINIYCFIEK